MSVKDSSLKAPWGKLVLIAAIVAAAIFGVTPLRERIRLGLDLQGGTYMVLRVELDEAVRSSGERMLADLRRDLTELSITPSHAAQESPGVIRLGGVSAEDESRAADAIERRAPLWDRSRDGEDVILTLRGASEKEMRDAAARQVRDTISRRINAFGVGETQLSSAGEKSDRLVLQLPGLDDAERVKAIITKASVMEFRLGDGGSTPKTALTREELEGLYGGQVPDDIEIVPSDPKGSLKGAMVAVKREAIVRGEDLVDARPETDRNQRPAIGFTLSADAGERFGAFTGANVGNYLAVVLDGQIVQWARIESQIHSRGVITGSFSIPAAQDAALTLRSGALPAKVTILEERTIGPSLGKDSIDSGMRAVVAGFLAVMLFLLIWYKGAGINAIVALGMNVVITMALLSLVGAALTLPGIAGLILTLVSAVDANVIIFERIKEEIVAGRGPAAAVESGFDKAFSAIFDSNVTTLVAAFFLYNFGTGPIQGFAVTLALGIIASMFTAIYVSRALFELLLWLRPNMKSLSIMWRPPKAPFIRFMRIAPVAVGISAIAVLFSLWMWLGRGLQYGIDFEGGVQAIVKTRSGMSADDLRTRLKGTEFEEVLIQSFGTSNDTFLLRILGEAAAARAEETRDVNVAGQDEADTGSASAVARLARVLEGSQAEASGIDLSSVGTQALADELSANAGLTPDEALAAAKAVTAERVRVGGLLPKDAPLGGIDMPAAARDWLASHSRSADFAVVSSEAVGPAIGAELRKKAVGAVVSSLLAILIYASFKFKFRYGLGAIVALAHDVIVAIGVLALLGYEFDTNIIAALLTLAGYSLNDTIVIFDRVRELAPKTARPLDELLDESVSLCLSRTFLTASTSLLAIGAILFFGGPVLKGFALALAIGMIAGTYSTIFVASPVVLLWDRIQRWRAARAARAAQAAA